MFHANRMKPLVIISMVLLAITFGAGCSSKLSRELGEQAVRSHIEVQSQGRLKLGAPEMTEESTTARSCRWVLVGHLEVVADGVWLYDSSESLHIDFRTGGTNELAAGKSVKRGERYSLVAGVYFEQEDQLWKVSHVGFHEYPRLMR